jgi:hypothetical protein
LPLKERVALALLEEAEVSTPLVEGQAQALLEVLEVTLTPCAPIPLDEALWLATLGWSLPEVIEALASSGQGCPMLFGPSASAAGGAWRRRRCQHCWRSNTAGEGGRC